MKISSFCLLAILISACAPSTWVHVNPERNFNHDSNYCDGYALTGTPPVTGNNFAPAINELGNGLTTLARRDTLWEICMRNFGWVEQK